MAPNADATKARAVGINHIALEVGNIDEALDFLDPWHTCEKPNMRYLS